MGVLRFNLIQLEPWQQETYGPAGRVDHVMEVHKVKIGDSTNLAALADVCARWTRAHSDENHVTIWAIVPVFDEDADVTREDTVRLFLRDTPKVTIKSDPGVPAIAPAPDPIHTPFVEPLEHYTPRVAPRMPDISEIETRELRHRSLRRNEPA